MATQPIPKVTEEPLAIIHHYIDAFNKGDMKAMAAAFAVPGSILDGMPRLGWTNSPCLCQFKRRPS